MNPRDFIILASRLAAGTMASERRTAISRGYYAVFNVAAETLRGLGFSVGKGAAAHGEVQKCLANSNDPSMTVVASKLNDLHAARNHADYQLDRIDVEGIAKARAIVIQAEEMIRAVDTAFNGTQRTQLQTAIRQWRQQNGYP